MMLKETRIYNLLTCVFDIEIIWTEGNFKNANAGKSLSVFFSIPKGQKYYYWRQTPITPEMVLRNLQESLTTLVSSVIFSCPLFALLGSLNLFSPVLLLLYKCICGRCFVGQSFKPPLWVTFCWGFSHVMCTAYIQKSVCFSC